MLADINTRFTWTKIIIILILPFPYVSAYSGEEYFDISPIKLPARDSEYLRQLISVDVTGDGNVDVLELTQDELGFALQKVKHVVGDELLLDWPILPEWNESLSALSIIDAPEPVLALLGNGTVDSDNRQALDLYHGIDLIEHFRIDLSIGGANIEPYDAMTIIEYNSIDDFTFAVSKNTNIEIYDQNYNQSSPSISFTDTIVYLEDVYFTNSLEKNVSVLDESGQLSILDLNDGSILWQSSLQLSKYKVGNFDADLNQEILAYSESLESLYLFDFSQMSPLWTFSQSELSDFILSDVNSDDYNEIYIIDNNGLINILNHNGQVSSKSYQTQNNNNFIGLLYQDSAPSPVILTENEIIEADLSLGLGVYSRQQKSFENYITADLNQNGTDDLIAIGKTVTEGGETNFLIEVIGTDVNNVTLVFETDFLDFEFDRYEIPVEVGQFDEDENLEIATIYYNGEDDFMTWANEIKIYDGLTFELEKSISLSAFDIWGVAFQIVSADRNNDGIDEIYMLYERASGNYQFDLAEIDVITSEISWDSRDILGIDFSGASMSRMVAGNFDHDENDELVIHYTWKFRVLDLGSMSFQLDLTNYFPFFSLESESYDSTFWTTSSGSFESTARRRNIHSDEVDEPIWFNLLNLQYLNQMASDIYFLINAEGVKVIDKSTDSLLDESKRINHNKFYFNNPQIVNSSVDSSIYYIGNSFGYWRIKRQIIDPIFKNGFEAKP